MSVKIETMTPEHYHLEHGEAKRDCFKEQQFKLQRMLKKALDAKLRECTKAVLGLDARKLKDGRRSNDFQADVGDLHVEFSLSADSKNAISAALEKQHPHLAVAGAKRRALCEQLNPAGAKRFGTFVRTKYGKAADVATIAKAHDEWILLISSCEC